MRVIILNNANISYVLQQNFCRLSSLIIDWSIIDPSMFVDGFNPFNDFYFLIYPR